MNEAQDLRTHAGLSDQSTSRVILFWVANILFLGLGSTLIAFLRDGMKVQVVVTAIGVAPVLIAFELNRRGHTQLAGSIIAVGLMLIVTVFATLGRGIYDITIMAYPAILFRLT